MARTELRRRFRELHTAVPDAPTPGILTMPNPWDVGSARILATSGFHALATTSAGFAASLGQHDQTITLDQLVDHSVAVAAAIDVPLNVDAEDCFADDVAGVTHTVRRFHETDVAGLSIEDWDPRAEQLRPVSDAAARVAAARAASDDLVLTARAENHLHGVADLDDTISRLCAYRDEGADVLYAPGLVAIDDIARVVAEVGAPINVLALPFGPTIPELADAGVARASLGSLLAWAAYGALESAIEEIVGPGTGTYAHSMLTMDTRRTAFG